MLILGIETSCDETSVALLEIKNAKFFLRQNLVYSQIKIHQKYGGVVPEVAARRHVEKIAPLIEKALKESGKKISAIAVTAGPGLAIALMVGVETARALSYLLKIPLIAVNHIEAHIYANWLPPSFHSNKNIFPALCLIVSGGHTELLLMKDHGRYKLIGQTKDDAVGECFDKVGKILGLPYPGGPAVAALAKKGNAAAIDFPRPMLNTPDFDFSYSGLKTAVLYYAQKPKNNLNFPKCVVTINDICASFQAAAFDVLIAKTAKAVKKLKVKSLILGGGVAANTNLQKRITNTIGQEFPSVKIFLPENKFCGDNAAMTAAAGYWHYLKKDFTPWQKIKINPEWELV